MRSWIIHWNSDYDLIPEFDFHLRKLFLSDEEGHSLKNSEYLSFSLGAFPSYHYISVLSGAMGESEPRVGLRPQGRISFGKFWMPVFPFRYGLDVSLSIGHYFLDGHPPGYSHTDYVTATLSVFRAGPRSD